jgi:hypothetical protein
VCLCSMQCALRMQARGRPFNAGHISKELKGGSGFRRRTSLVLAMEGPSVRETAIDRYFIPLGPALLAKRRRGFVVRGGLPCETEASRESSSSAGPSERRSRCTVVSGGRGVGKVVRLTQYRVYMP